MFIFFKHIVLVRGAEGWGYLRWVLTVYFSLCSSHTLFSSTLMKRCVCEERGGGQEHYICLFRVKIRETQRAGKVCHWAKLTKHRLYYQFCCTVTLYVSTVYIQMRLSWSEMKLWMKGLCVHIKLSRFPGFSFLLTCLLC